MSRRVVVIGAGASGTAAAYAASRLGARVTVIMGRPGATSLSSGALDGDLEAAGDEAHAFIDAIGIWEIGDCHVATRAGLLRPARGRDLSVLDLQRIEPGVVAVVDVMRRGWDARALAAIVEPRAVGARARVTLRVGRGGGAAANRRRAHPIRGSGCATRRSRACRLAPRSAARIEWVARGESCGDGSVARPRARCGIGADASRRQAGG